ncbi:MAG TPA: ArsR/SmtB family transcription factor [Candidatus Brocadiia bacterium]|nr:winged helix-turn-helix transcriptional regulator [Planctomycetota bacterium]MDO8092595.1 metalloregulator ArsR/SmtB family transcription factor [Candidatus Brocadiales bacterium]
MELIVEFKALADHTRLRILGILLNRSLCVCEIMDILGMTQSRISRHLGVLKQAGFVKEERRGKWVIYRIAHKRSAVLAYIQKQLKGDHSHTIDLARIKRTLRKKLCPIDY